ncbi:acetate CoA/acetoacetate CoA-transferase beta subunit [Bacilli bacterium PM5-3]|nr:acetate CoA/acetoacetate CoA-transferase beta subunit [Bacilli bacterium PM5-3]MDH6603662.1 acetate CoA/acetoacetate CoA-transferase beta subunit [Bacilli bacterium PM5-9]
MDVKEKIVKRVAQELQDGQLVNLGIGMPTLVANYLPEDVSVVLQSENGMVGLIGLDGKEPDLNITNAGGQYVDVDEYGAFFDSSYSFALIRGGHVDATVLGTLEVDQEGNIANYMIPGKLVPGMGGAMDLVTGAKRVIVSTTHTSKGAPKILKKCTLPITGCKSADMIVTELAVFEVKDNYLLLTEVAEESSVEEVLELTEADVKLAEDIKRF